MRTAHTESGAIKRACPELKALRKAMEGKISQPKLAKLLDVSRDIIVGIEVGIKRLTPNMARRIRSCTGCMIFSEEEKSRGPNWENLPLRDFAGRPYTPTSYREWCAWKASLDADGAAYRGSFLGEAIDIFSTALLQADEKMPNGLRNNRLINFWNRIPDILLDLLEEPAVAGEVERELMRRFGKNGQENFLTFLRCLHGVALPVEGEFSAFHMHKGPDDYGQIPPTYADRVTINSIMRSMCTFRRWRRVTAPNDWGSN
jgi:DNA-binding XRE family transcriptional regulator